MSERNFFYYSRNQALSVTIIFTISLFLFWNIKVSEIGSNFLGPDSFIIVDRILNSIKMQWFEQTYTSQLGLQSIILSFLNERPFNFGVVQISVFSSLMISLITALAFSTPAYKIMKIAGVPAVAFYWISLALSGWMTSFSYSLYWVPFTMILPFIVTFIFGSSMTGNKNKKVLFFVSLAMFIKCLCGYEYITTVTLFACAGYTFSLIGKGVQGKISDILLIFFACVAGFAFAVFIHSMQLHSIDSSFGLHTILTRAEAHTGTDGGGDCAQILIDHLSSRTGNEEIIGLFKDNLNDHKALFVWTAFKEYFYLPAMQIFGFTLKFGLFALISIIISYFCIKNTIKHKRIDLSGDFNLFSLGCFLMLVGVFSWQILAWHHMTIHYHLNGQLFAYGIVPVSMVFVGFLIHKVLNTHFLNNDLLTKTPVFIIALACIYLTLAIPFSNSISIVDNFQTFSKRNVAVIGHVDQVIITPSSTELNRGLGISTSKVSLTGWAISKGNARPKLFVMINDALVGEISPDLKRYDVKKVYKTGEDSGFSFTYDAPGNITKENIKVLASDGSGGYSVISF